MITKKIIPTDEAASMKWRITFGNPGEKLEGFENGDIVLGSMLNETNYYQINGMIEAVPDETPLNTADIRKEAFTEAGMKQRVDEVVEAEREAWKKEREGLESGIADVWEALGLELPSEGGVLDSEVMIGAAKDLVEAKRTAIDPDDFASVAKERDELANKAKELRDRVEEVEDLLSRAKSAKEDGDKVVAALRDEIKKLEDSNKELEASNKKLEKEAKKAKPE